MCIPQHKQFHSASCMSIQDEADDNEEVETRFRDVNKTLTMQYAQGFALLLVVFTYVRRGGMTNECLDSMNEEISTAANDLYFPGSSWLIPYFIVGVYSMMRVTRLLSQGIEKLQQYRRHTVVHVQTNLTKVSSREALSRISSQVSSILQTCNNNITNLRSSKSLLPAITSPVCFARSDYIEQLSAADISTIFRYANIVNRDDFDRKAFVSEQNTLIRAVVTAMDVAVQLSRGSSATHHTKEQQLKQQQQQQQQQRGEKQEKSEEGSGTSSPVSNNDHGAAAGDMDALYFVAAARIFAEWRVLRLVPPGYARYTFSMNLARRDMLQNLTMIENSVHGYLKQIQQSPEHDSNLDDTTKTTTPTLRGILQYELTTRHMHQKLPHLDGDSAALGLLWTKRQIEYQVSIFENSLNVPVQFQTAKDAALAAYDTVYHEYHGWAVQQVFKSSFGGSPPLEEIWRHINPPTHHLKSKNEGSKKKTEFRPPPRLIAHLSSSSDSDDSDDENVFREKGKDNELAVALDKLGRNLIGAWEETVQFLSRFVCVVPDDEHQHRGRNLIISHESYLQMTDLIDPSMIDTSDLVLSEEDSDDDDNDERSHPSLRDMSLALSIDQVADHSASEQPPTPTEPAMDVVQKVKTNVRDQIKVLKPFVGEWNDLIMELNMNDPSKV